MANEQLDKLLDDINSQLSNKLSDFDPSGMVNASLYNIKPEFELRMRDLEFSHYNKELYRYFFDFKYTVNLKQPIHINLSDMYSIEFGSIIFGSNDTTIKLGDSNNHRGFVLIPEGLFKKYNVSIDNLDAICALIEKYDISSIFNTKNFIKGIQDSLGETIMDYLEDIDADLVEYSEDFVKEHVSPAVVKNAGIKNMNNIAYIDANIGLGHFGNNFDELFEFNINVTKNSVEITNGTNNIVYKGSFNITTND